MTGREKLSRVAAQALRDADALVVAGDEEGAIRALQNHVTLLTVATLRSDEFCETVYQSILKQAPQILPS